MDGPGKDPTFTGDALRPLKLVLATPVTWG
jgi:hypothetical protein